MASKWDNQRLQIVFFPSKGMLTVKANFVLVKNNLFLSFGGALTRCFIECKILFRKSILGILFKFSHDEFEAKVIYISTYFTN